MVKNGQNSFWKKIDHCVINKIRQGLCGENFSSLAWKMAKFVFLMLHSGQKWSKVNLKKIWPLCFEKDQARGLWWKFQLSSMKNGKVSIFDVAQWSKMVKSQFEKNLTTVFWKRSGKGLWWKFQLFSMKNGKVSIFGVAQWSKMVKIQFDKIWNFGATCVP